MHVPGSTVAQAILSQLAAGGVKRVYGVVGDAIFPLADALAAQHAVEFVPAAQEAGAAFMASYEAKLTGCPTACMATAGPGATNLATGLADAFLDGAPVVAITGQIQTADFAIAAKQYFHQQTFFGPISASTELPLAGESAMHALLAALYRSIRYRTATHISIPEDVFRQSVEWMPLPVRALDGDDAAPTPGLEMSPPCLLGDWARAVQALRQSRSPLVVVGLSEPTLVRETLDLARALDAGLIAAQQAKGTIPFSESCLVGGIGEAHVPEALHQADILVLVGDAPYEMGYIPARIPAVVVSREHVPLSGHPLLAEAIGAPVRAVGWLRRAMEGRVPDPAWSEAIRKVRQALDEQVRDLAGAEPHAPVNPYRLAQVLSDILDEDAVISVDIGAFSHWFDLGFRVKRQTILISSRWRGMGAALPAAIAARLACPDRQAVAVIGDGALLMSMAELTTAVARALPLTVVVVNNGVYDLERQKMSSQGLHTMGTVLRSPDFVALAQACGAVGLRVDRVDDLAGALERGMREAVRSTGPVLIDVRASAPALPHLMVGPGTR